MEAPRHVLLQNVDDGEICTICQDQVSLADGGYALQCGQGNGKKTCPCCDFAVYNNTNTCPSCGYDYKAQGKGKGKAKAKGKERLCGARGRHDLREKGLD